MRAAAKLRRVVDKVGLWQVTHSEGLVGRVDRADEAFDFDLGSIHLWRTHAKAADELVGRLAADGAGQDEDAGPRTRSGCRWCELEASPAIALGIRHERVGGADHYAACRAKSEAAKENRIFHARRGASHPHFHTALVAHLHRPFVQRIGSVRTE